MTVPADSASLILFGPLPPPFNGHTLAFQLCVRGCESLGLKPRVIDYSPRWRLAVRMPLGRWLEYAAIMARYAYTLLSCGRGTVYITLNQAVDGVICDLVLITSARMLGYRVVVHIHGGRYDALLTALPAPVRRLMIRALASCHAVIILSERLRYLFKAWPEVMKQVRVVPNCLPFEPAGCPARAKSISFTEPVGLLFLSHLMESKGWHLVLETVERLVNHHHINVRARFCGQFLASRGDVRFSSADAARAWFNEFVTDKRLSDNVRYDGHIDGDEKISALRDAHFLLLPSTDEGQPLALIEGLAYGCALIAPPCRAIPDMIIDGITGLLVPPDPVLMADKIAFIIKQPAVYQAMSAAAISLFRERFMPDRHIRELVGIITETEISSA